MASISKTAIVAAGIVAAGIAAAGLASPAAQAAPSDIARPLVRYVPDGMIITPRSSQQTAAMIGREMHTNTRIFVPAGGAALNSAPSGKYENPASLACLYGPTTYDGTCNPETLTTVSTKGSKTIAIVDAYSYPNAMSDLNTFSSRYGLPAVTSSTFKIMYGSGTKPGTDSTGGWELEEALDIEMAHAMAPKATIILVEASSSSTAALLQAETVAANAVAGAGGGEVSNSWGGSETSNESSDNSYFATSSVVFFASAGDSSGTEFPSVLTDVVGVGGTTIKRTSAGAYSNETTWSDTGGGISSYIARPTFQNAVSAIVGSKRGAPDVAADANPSSGAWVYDTNKYEGSVLDWTVVGGTSEASPLWAGIVNAAATFNSSSGTELSEIYANLGVTNDFFDITTGSCPNAASGSAGTGYDLCTGVGSSTSLVGK